VLATVAYACGMQAARPVALSPDIDCVETQEWIEALGSILETSGPERCQFILEKLLQCSRASGVAVRTSLNSPYCNTISVAKQARFPGDLELETQISSLVRWNAVAMVVRANRLSTELGGHLASYASAADLFEVGFNHFFRGGRDGDLVFFQPHSAPGVYARAFLEGRLTEENLGHYRQECGGKGLPSYPHPWLMPDFWQFPTGSMGIGPIAAIYQARFMRYLEHRGLLEASERRVWALVGDGEMDEPESLAALGLAGRENLDNLTFVVNCNLQRLDGPVRGNGSIIQELERVFTGAGWNVVKLLWGSDWDDLFARDPHHAILKRLEETVDGELQTYSAKGAEFNRARFFNKSAELREVASHLSDQQIASLTRGGHDPIKIYAAFHAAVQQKGQPTVVLAQTKKGFGLGPSAEGKMAAHQQKKLDHESLLSLRDRFCLPLTDSQAEDAVFYKPPAGHPAMQYLRDRRQALGGYLPRRAKDAPILTPPSPAKFANWALESETHDMSTTVAFVKMLAGLMKDPELGPRIVPIVADEARTFGMQSLFRQYGIYAPTGQLYEPEDQADFLYYKEARDGQILEEGITEAGALSSWIAAGTAYSNHGLATLPFYAFYSMFGFQRVGDLIWAAADSRTRGFLIGATSGRTTLAGEGLQHQDGTSHLIASTVPNCRAYDPCYAYELAVILDAGMQAMLHRQKDVFYYVTVTNSNYAHPSMPANAEEGILRGMYLLRAARSSELSVTLLGSGPVLHEVIAAADLLLERYGIDANVFSVTSFSELRWDGMSTERWNRLHPDYDKKTSWIERCLKECPGPIVGVSDYVRAVADLIRPWVRGPYVALGTDGFGRSDTRSALRSFFEIDRASIALAALSSLADSGRWERAALAEAIEKLGCECREANPWDV
jgi:pyruvate dehydrogenase E1 component